MTITIEEAQASLVDIVDNLKPGDEVLIVRGQELVARLVGEAHKVRKPREPGRERAAIPYIPDDFDAPLEDFAEYMQ